MKWDFAFDKKWRKEHQKVIVKKPEPDTRRDLASMSFPEDRDEAKALTRGAIQEYQCPFAWMIRDDIESIDSIF